MRRVFGGNLGVLDLSAGQVHVYAPDGTHVRSTPTSLRTRSPLMNQAFIWENPAVFFNGGLPAGIQDGYQHHIWYWSAADEDPRIEGFGDRFDDVIEHTGQVLPMEHFAAVDGRLWLGDPYSSQTHIHEMDGRYLSTLDSHCTHPMDHDRFLAFEGFGDHKAFFVFRNTHCFNQGIFPVTRNLVLINHGARGVLLFDGEGRPRSKHLLNDLGFPRDAGQGRLLTVFHEEMTHKPHYELETEMARTSGWREGGNPVLRIGRWLGEK